MNLRLPNIALAAFVAGFANVNAVIEWPTVDTAHNKVGLEYVEVCKFNPDLAKIICKTKEGAESPEVFFDSVEVIEGSSTGTPPWLQHSNYIGQTLGEDAHGMPGAGKRTIYLKK